MNTEKFNNLEKQIDSLLKELKVYKADLMRRIIRGQDGVEAEGVLYLLSISVLNKCLREDLIEVSTELQEKIGVKGNQHETTH